jgi:hypothetical protein
MFSKRRYADGVDLIDGTPFPDASAAVFTFAET